MSKINVLMSKVKKYNYYMLGGKKINLGGSCTCIYNKELVQLQRCIALKKLKLTTMTRNQ